MSMLDEYNLVHIITSCKTSLLGKSRFIQRIELAKIGGLLQHTVSLNLPTPLNILAHSTSFLIV